MRNTLRQTSYVVFVGTWAPVAAIVALRSTFEAMFPAPESQPASEGPVLSCWTNLSIGDQSGALAGEKLLESVLPTISLAVLHSDQPDCSVCLL